VIVELSDRDVIARWCRRRPAVDAYLLGDLDDFFWPHTRWYGWQPAGSLEQIVLLYTEPEVPVLLGFGVPGEPALSRLLRAVEPLLPERLYAHTGVDGLAALRPAFAVEHGPEPHLKLGLGSRERLASAVRHEVERLGPGDLDEVERFYRASYPGTWFHPRMLETGRYVAIRAAGAVVCIAGVHVWSPRYRVACLGNVATLPAERGRGLATSACASLCLLLLEDGIETISLNAHEDNAHALGAYARLGFERAAAYLEVGLWRDTPPPGAATLASTAPRS
jgi:GNAT superfamily N-acetyltransferase